ncbi:hypothetical protein BgiBS90_028589 [Biomphalaria glabrata]|nr:hypothetical protein BgiBS90_028589 [Biomphalaria glabrata]
MGRLLPSTSREVTRIKPPYSSVLSIKGAAMGGGGCISALNVPKPIKREAPRNQQSSPEMTCHKKNRYEKNSDAVFPHHSGLF